MADAVITVVALVAFAPVALLSAMLSAGLILASWSWLNTYALARPNARSSHRDPTPQGGGAAVVLATFAIALVGATVFSTSLSAGDLTQLLALTAATALLAVVGAVDDIRTLAPLPRLLLQGIAAAIVIAALPAELRVVPLLPWWVERGLVLLAGVWFINLTNFMDGIDWMTVAEVVPVTVGIVIFGVMGVVPPLPALIALVLCGAMLGFAPFNKPVARLFLGDVGSLPIGLVIAWLLLHLAVRGQLAAALILPLYYVADATITLFRRIAAREPIWQAHRSHFYQRAIDGGFAVSEIVARVFVLNLGLVALAIMAIMSASRIVSLASLIAAAALVGVLLLRFARGKP
jgi:UDP-N-acetylmuramyl pentapeptide phosphotransferase/UDP-N-acetylglucosamine-1-phosphate transferase